MFFFIGEKGEEKKMRKQMRIGKRGIILSLFVLALVLFPGTRLFAQEFNQSIAKEAGLEVKDTGLDPIYDEGKYLGEIYLMVDAISADNEILFGPIKVPIYKGENLASVVNYQFYAHANATGDFQWNMGTHFFRNRNRDGSYVVPYYLEKDAGKHDKRYPKDLKSSFVISDIQYNEDKKSLNIPETVQNYARDKNIPLDSNLKEERYEKLLAKGCGSEFGRWEVTKNGESIDQDLSKYTTGKELQAGDFIRISYSILGEDKGYDAGTDKTQLMKNLGEINSSGEKNRYLKNSSYKTSYDKALATLKNFKATNQEVKEAAESLKSWTLDPHPQQTFNFAFYEHQLDKENDFLLSNLDYTLKLGDEMEVFNLDVHHAAWQDENFQREDLKLEPVLGGDKVEIRRDSGKKVSVQGNHWANVKDGASYFIRGLKEGLVKIKVTAPNYSGRPTYMFIYVTNRSTDFKEQRLPMGSSLDELTKYDVLYFSKDHPDYPLEVKAVQGARVTFYADGKKINLSKGQPQEQGGQVYDTYTAKVPLRNFWLNGLLTVEKDGKKSTKIYNLRTAYLEAYVLNKKGEKKLKAGEEGTLHIDGMLAPKPKIGKFYNPPQGLPEFITNFPSMGYINAGYEETGGAPVTFTKSGQIDLKHGEITTVAYGSAGFEEVPKNQMPENTNLNIQRYLSKMSDGLNRPQIKQSYKRLPDFSFHIEENPGYSFNNEGLIKASPKKSSYQPGERVEVTVDIPDALLEELNNKHSKYVVPENKGQSQTFENTNAINYAYLLYSSNIPGLEKIETYPKAHNMYLNKQEKLEGLKKLRTLSFTLPETTSPGDYFINGAYLQVHAGPTHGTVAMKYWVNKLDSFNLHVEGDPLINKKPKLKEVQLTEADFIIPSTGNLEIDKDHMEATIRSEKQGFLLTTEKEVDSIRMECIKPWGNFETQELETEDHRTFKSTTINLPADETKIRFVLKKGQEEQAYILDLTNYFGKEFPQEKIKEIEELKILLDLANKASEKDYSKEAWENLQKAKKHGETLLELVEYPSPDQVNGAIKALKDALGEKAEKEDPVDPTPNPEIKEGQIEKPRRLTVNRGQTKEDIMGKLPKTLLYIWPDGKGQDVEITWDLAGAQLDRPGTYTLLGFYQVPPSKDQNVVEVSLEVRSDATFKEGQDVERQWQGQGETKQAQENKAQENPTQDPSVLGQKQNKVILSGPGTRGFATSSKNISSFVDIQGHWAQGVIEKCVQEGLFVGIDDQHFAPNRPISQGELLTLLGRMAGVADNQDPNQAYYAPFRDWAMNQAIINPKDFRAEKILNREEMADLTYKALRVMGKDLSPKREFNLKDKKKISKAYQDSVVRLVRAGYLQGTEKNTFAPKAQLTRAQVAQILWTLYEK